MPASNPSSGAPAQPAYRLPVRVYYEDTDAAGVVYYANYLRFFERARTEWLRTLGYEQSLLARQGVAFAARSVTAEYLMPARLDDRLEVVSTIAALGRAQVTFAQRIERNGELLVDGSVRVACFDPNRMKAMAMPRDIYDKFNNLLGNPA